jgi:hypothetical protein
LFDARLDDGDKCAEDVSDGDLLPFVFVRLRFCFLFVGDMGVMIAGGLSVDDDVCCLNIVRASLNDNDGISSVDLLNFSTQIQF